MLFCEPLNPPEKGEVERPKYWVSAANGTFVQKGHQKMASFLSFLLVPPRGSLQFPFFPSDISIIFFKSGVQSVIPEEEI